MRSCFFTPVVALVTAAGAAGCAPAWTPPIQPAPGTATPRYVHLSAYGVGADTPTRVYARHDLIRPDDPPETYRRQGNRYRQVEGTLIGRTEGPLCRYVPADGAGPAPPPHLSWPPSTPGGSAFFLKIDPPLPHLPCIVDVRHPITRRSTVHLFNWCGRHLFEGTMERTVRFAGFEPAGSIEHVPAECLRLKIQSRIRLSWGPRVDVTEFVWLAPRLGEVRRVELLRGWAWFLPFNSAWQYDLVESQGAGPTVARTRTAQPRWSIVAVHLEKSLPHPRLGGLAVEFEYAAPDAPASTVADRQGGVNPIGG